MVPCTGESPPVGSHLLAEYLQAQRKIPQATNRKGVYL
jgi:hypothetical protein